MITLFCMRSSVEEGKRQRESESLLTFSPKQMSGDESVQDRLIETSFFCDISNNVRIGRQCAMYPYTPRQRLIPWYDTLKEIRLESSRSFRRVISEDCTTLLEEWLPSHLFPENRRLSARD